MRPRVKICCIQDLTELHAAVQAGADAVGFVGKGCSGPEVIADDRLIGRLSEHVPPPVASVLLVRGTDPQDIIERAQVARASVLQLIDPLDGAAHNALRHALPGVRFLDVIHVTGPHARTEARERAGLADALLLDSGSPADGVFGGTGQTHDWSISAQIVRDVDVPVWLAGGLRPSNLLDAWEQVRPFGFDICSGVRTDGQLDPAKAALLCRMAAAMG